MFHGVMPDPPRRPRKIRVFRPGQVYPHEAHGHPRGIPPRINYRMTHTQAVELLRILQPGDFFLPSRSGGKPTQRSVEEIIQDMVHGGYATLKPVALFPRQLQQKDVAPSFEAEMTIRGRARGVVNQYLLGKPSYARLPQEKREAIAKTHLIELIYTFDFNPQKLSFDHRKRLELEDVKEALFDEADYRTASASLRSKYGAVERKWPAEIRKYAHFLVRRAQVSRDALVVLDIEHNWVNIMTARHNNTLEKLIPPFSMRFRSLGQ